VEKKKKNRAGRMGFSSIQKTTSTGSSTTGALVGANSLQPGVTTSCITNEFHDKNVKVKEAP